ncbi:MULTISPECIES: MCE family protein [Rhodococcus]|uniref:MCE family protein n=1 Tax=Rhodococcus oxybenzonivorans TaxID=1990687 RepID=A0AAE4UXZ5_9NOCA|nr:MULTISPECIES: MCE family protein [Rhodococcus]MDV7241962.1 MCE family protein [Rhodococcus oxybenzonivorans]MDV7265001.1 MCE family protein [Rhodococcus oxybenzonivorans]MDV7277774.1 MCE family protein [Rhodococcus oxybenzonivorans]MDV7334244.1 MCE family protein [Rhodococcus oxybenzonivorans]MDV7343663.1 MCE family protein [Rhodococcus oxybenzonivorans]
MRNTTSVVGRRVLGLVFFLVLALFLAVTIGMFDKTFTKVVKIGLVTDTVGNALPPNADVKVRGLIVGEVRSASTKEGEVTLDLAIQPDKAELIPSNATARLLPKTLFGERYVSLIVPEGDTAPPIQAGDVLEQDKSGNAVEIGEVLDGLLPLLQAIPPQDLANTLGALSQGLSGRGAELGLTLDRLEEIFAGLNTELPAIQEDLRGIADFSQTYSEAAPDLVNALDNLRTTGNTVVEKQGVISRLLATLTGTSSSTADLLHTNAQNIVLIAADSREALQLLGRYSPSFGCTLADFVEAAPIARELLALDDPNPGGRGTVQFINPKGRYLPNQDEPRLLDNRGPACYDDVTAPGGKFPQYPGGSFNDGSYQVPTRNPGPPSIEYFPAPAGVPDQVPGWGAEIAPASYAGSKMEQDTLDVVYGEAGGIAPEDVPSWTTLVGAPTIRGTEVTFE